MLDYCPHMTLMNPISVIVRCAWGRVLGSKIGKPCNKWVCNVESLRTINPLRPNNDLSQTSPCNIKGLSGTEVLRIENMITQMKFY